jgi:hypothetical protein
MFLLNGKPLALDRAFTTEDGTQYPANWLRLATPEQRAAIGITEAAPEPTYDQRFYWGPDLPKDHAQLVEQWVSTTKVTAGTLLAPTDWYITRASETGVAAPQSVLDRRSAIRTLSNEKEAFLAATTTTQELAEYVTSQAYTTWEDTPVIEIGVTSEATTTSTPITGIE